jgi:hypothetical protein
MKLKICETLRRSLSVVEECGEIRENLCVNLFLKLKIRENLREIRENLREPFFISRR